MWLNITDTALSIQRRWALGFHELVEQLLGMWQIDSDRRFFKLIEGCSV
jgi:hypothetical protein